MKYKGYPKGMFDQTIRETGAVLRENCPGIRKCQCGSCRVCGYSKHTAIHGPLADNPTEGSKPYGHEFQPRED